MESGVQISISSKNGLHVAEYSCAHLLFSGIFLFFIHTTWSQQTFSRQLQWRFESREVLNNRPEVSSLASRWEVILTALTAAHTHTGRETFSHKSGRDRWKCSIAEDVVSKQRDSNRFLESVICYHPLSPPTCWISWHQFRPVLWRSALR